MTAVMRLTIAGLILSLLSVSVSAQVVKRGTREEAVEIVKKVKRMWQTIGPQKTLDAVNKLTNNLKNKDLYPFIGHVDGYLAGHYFQSLRGINQMEGKDQRDKYVFRSFIKMVKSNGKGWVSYDWPNPITKRIDAKETYLEAINSEYFVGVGVFKKLRDDEIR
ncbi:MAG: cache domain-containing protein [Methyloligellaceae bacterium]